MGQLEERFDDEIRKAGFNVLEISGFQEQPMLAVKAGMAIGYKMAVEDFEAADIPKRELI